MHMVLNLPVTEETSPTVKLFSRAKDWSVRIVSTKIMNTLLEQGLSEEVGNSVLMIALKKFTDIKRGRSLHAAVDPSH
jgi:hypothetical protein